MSNLYFVDLGSISSTFLLDFFRKQDEKFFLTNGVCIWQISAHKFGFHFGGEIEWQMFCQTLCAIDFLPGKQSLVKSTPIIYSVTVLVDHIDFPPSQHIHLFLMEKVWKTPLPRVDLTNIILEAYMGADLKNAKKYSQAIFFALLGSACAKAARKMLMKLTTGLFTFEKR